MKFGTRAQPPPRLTLTLAKTKPLSVGSQIFLGIFGDLDAAVLALGMRIQNSQVGINLLDDADGYVSLQVAAAGCRPGTCQ